MTSTAMLVGYSLGFVACAAGAVVVGELASPATRPSRAQRLVFAAIAGAIWPIVVLGLIQGLLIARLLKRRRAAQRRRQESDSAPGLEGSEPVAPPEVLARSPSLAYHRLIDVDADAEPGRRVWTAVATDPWASRNVAR